MNAYDEKFDVEKEWKLLSESINDEELENEIRQLQLFNEEMEKVIKLDEDLDI